MLVPRVSVASHLEAHGLAADFLSKTLRSGEMVRLDTVKVESSVSGDSYVGRVQDKQWKRMYGTTQAVGPRDNSGEFQLPCAILWLCRGDKEVVKKR